MLHVAVAEEVSQTLQILLSRWSFKEGVNTSLLSPRSDPRCKKHGTEEDVARFVNNSNRDKQTAMHIACDRSFCDGVKILMSYKVQ